MSDAVLSFVIGYGVGLVTGVWVAAFLAFHNPKEDSDVYYDG